MLETVSISDLQRQGKKAFTEGAFAQIVLANNKKSGLIFSQETLEVLEMSGLLDELEDKLLAYHMKPTFEADDFVSLESVQDAL